MPSNRCMLLDKLPSEQRIDIFELVYDQGLRATDLIAATPPSRALAQTCRRIINEAATVYERAYRTFWTTANFIMNQEQRKPYGQDLAAVERVARGLEHVSHLALRKPEDGSGIKIYTFTLLSRHGSREVKSSTGDLAYPILEQFFGRLITANACASERRAQEALAAHSVSASIKNQLVSLILT